MKNFIVIIFCCFLISSCFFKEDCENLKYFPLPDRVSFNKSTIESIEQYVVIDSLNNTYKQINSLSPNSNILLPYYANELNKEYIQSMDFMEDSKIKVYIWSNGKIIKALDSNYSQSDQKISFIGTLSGEYVNAYVIPNSYVSIPYVMSFYNKYNQIQTYNNISVNEGISFNYRESLVKDLIKKEKLQKNDTVFINKINLIYKPN